MHTEQYAVQVPAPNQVVFDFITNQERLSEWLPGLITSEVIGGGPVRPGVILRQVREQGGKRITGEAMVVAHARPFTHAVEVNIMNVATRFAFKLSPDKNSTTVVLQATYTADGFFGALMERLVAAMCNSCNEKTVQNLKVAIEHQRIFSRAFTVAG